MGIVAWAVFGGGPFARNAVAGGGSWSSAIAVSPTNQPDPTRGSQFNDVAVNALGDTVAAWDQYTYNNGGGATIGVAVQSAGRWGNPFTISRTDGFAMYPRVAVGADGTMAVSWSFETPVTGPAPTRSVQVAVRPAGASAWTVSTLATMPLGGVTIGGFVPIAVDPAGNVTAVWPQWNGQQHVVQAAHRPAATAAGTPGDGWRLDGAIAAGDALYPSLAINARGDAAVAFAVSPYTSSAGICDPAQPTLAGTCVIHVFRNGPAGTWEPQATVSPVLSSSVGYISGAQVALDGNGLSTVIWFGNGVEGTRQLTRTGSGSTATTTWTPSRVVIPAPAGSTGASFQNIDLAGDQSGNVVVVTSIFASTPGVNRASVFVADVQPAEWGGSALLAPVRLTDPAANVDAYAARAAISADGALALVGWIDHYHGEVQSAQYDRITGTWGATRTVGRGTAFSSFQEVLGLKVGSNSVARAVWKSSAKGGTRTMAANFK